MTRNCKNMIGFVVLAVICVTAGGVMADLASWNAEITAANPVNWYKFDEASGTDCLDSGSNGLNGVYSAVTLAQDGALGAGTAATFSSSVVTFTGATNIDGDWTAEYVVKKMAMGSQALNDGGTSVRLEGWGAGGNAAFTLYGVADYYFTPVPGESMQAPLEQWSHVAFRRNADGTQLFIDGRLVGTHTATIAFPRDRIGAGGTGVDALNAVLDEAIAYDSALIDEQIARHAFLVLPSLIPDYFELYADSAELQGLWSGDATVTLETTEVYDGTQSMKAEFASAGTVTKDVGREFDLTSKTGQDFFLMLKGDAGNDAGDVTISVHDPNGVTLDSVTYTNGTQVTDWSALIMKVSENADPNLYWTNVDSVQIDVGAAATMYFDGIEIKLPPAPAKKVVEWKLDEGSGTDALDSSGNSIDGTLNNFIGSAYWVQGNTADSGDYAVQFDGTAGLSITALGVDLSGLDVEDIFKGASSWTINMWVNHNLPSGVAMIGGFGDCDFVENDGMSDRYLNLWDGTLEFNYGDWGLWPGTKPAVNEWHMYTVSYNRWTKAMTMYVDAEVVATGAPTLVDTPENAFKLGDVGAVAWAASIPIIAAIDDFCVYDQELPWMDDDPETDDVLSLYGDWICYEAPAYDLDGDCQVNMSDLAELIAAWLESGRYPADL